MEEIPPQSERRQQAPPPPPSTAQPYIDHKTNEVRFPIKWIVGTLIAMGGLTTITSGGSNAILGLFSKDQTEAVQELKQVVEEDIKERDKEMEAHKQRPHEDAAYKKDVEGLESAVTQLQTHQQIMQYQLNEQTKVGREILEEVRKD